MVTSVEVAPARFAYRTVEVGEPQLFVDDYLVDNRFNEDLLSARVPHVLHPPQRPTAPILAPDEAHPWELGGMTWPSVVYDAPTRLFRMYYQVYQRFWDKARFPEAYRPLPSEQGPTGERPGGPGYPPGKYYVGYAESSDGIHWERPRSGRFPWGQHRETNIVMQGEREAFTPHVHVPDGAGTGPDGVPVRTLGLLPPAALRGHRFLMFYGDHDHYLATSEDGAHWDERRQCVFGYRSDAFHTLSYDEVRGEYVCYPRNTKAFSTRADGRQGNRRMIARFASADLWSQWDADSVPSTVVLSDAGDADRYYGMSSFRYGGVHWGFLQRLFEDEDRAAAAMSASRDGGEWGGAGGAAGIIDTELIFSRDGITWQRMPGYPRFFPIGEPGSWDNGMLFGPDRVIERGDEWWMYYNGWHGPHWAVPGPGEGEKLGTIGLARCRKEGFVSIRADASGQRSYVVTRPLLWKGGDLLVNVDAATRGGAFSARVTDYLWNEIPGFGFDQTARFTGDAVRYRVRWGERSLDDLAGRYVRVEFQIANADLFAFVASPRA
jgi:hypothetical protein